LARETAIVAVLADGKPRDLAEIAFDVYAGTPDAPAFLRELQTRAHLTRLVRLGQVAKTGDRYRRAADE
jgi:hypothetical protein